MLGGAWTSFERSKLGTLTAELTDGKSWRATTYAGGTGLSSVTYTTDQAGTSVPLEWDSAGRATRVDGVQFAWTGDDRPSQILVGAGASSSTEDRYYDAFGRVVRIVQNGEVLDKVYAGAEVIREFSDCAERTWWLTGAMDHPAAYSIAWDDTSCPIADLDNGDPRLAVLDLSYQAVTGLPDISEPGGTTFGVVQDLHGDVVGLLDGAGNLVESYVYDVYGGRTVAWSEVSNGQFTNGGVCPNVPWGPVCTSELGNPRGYTGQFLSGVTGLYDLRNRLYDPRVRVFVSADPLGFVDGYDLWQYVGEDPLNFVDPWGLNDDSIFAPSGSTDGLGWVVETALEVYWKANAGAINTVVDGAVAMSEWPARMEVVTLVDQALQTDDAACLGGVCGEALAQAAYDAKVDLSGEIGFSLLLMEGTGGALREVEVLGRSTPDAAGGVVPEPTAAEVATSAALAEADVAQTMPKTTRPRTVAALATRDGKPHIGRSLRGGEPNLHKLVKKAYDRVPLEVREKWHSMCAEGQCLSNALEEGANPRGGTLSSVKVRGKGNPEHGGPIEPCKSCGPLLEELGVEWKFEPVRGRQSL